jgi:hypothetical protein
MAETKGSGEEPFTQQSSGAPFKLNGKRNTEQPVLGAIESFGSYVFKYSTSDQVDMYNRTYEHLIGYVTMEYGSDMNNLVKYQQEKTFTKPEAPTAAARKDNDLLVIVWKEELSRYHREEKEYHHQKVKVLGVILSQCSREVKSRLESTPTFAETEQTNDIISLLAMLKKMSHSTDGVQEPYWALQNVLRCLTAMNQGKHNESRKTRDSGQLL